MSSTSFHKFFDLYPQLTISFQKYLFVLYDRFFNLPRRWHLGIIGTAALLLFLLEGYAIFASSSSWVVELLLFLGFLGNIGLLIGFLFRAMRKQDHAKQILDYKHKLSLELVANDSWNELVQQLAKFPSKMAPVDRTCFVVNDPITQKLEPVSRWGDDEGMLEDGKIESICQKCVEHRFDTTRLFNPCEALPQREGKNRNSYYCLPIHFSGNLMGLLQFRLKPGERLSESQKEILKNINDEMAIALIAGQDRRRLAEMRSAEADLSEQHPISNLQHENLGRNIGYLRLKLEQLSNNTEMFPDEVREDLARIQAAANESYEIIHGTLGSMDPDTTPQLNNLLHEHARKISQSANFILTFKTEGRPLPVTSETQRVIFYVFQEILNNIEKHAKATKVMIFVGWAFGILTISVADNGKGFDPEGVKRNRNSGLNLMHERISHLDGQIEFRSSNGEGTTVTFIVPNLASRLRTKQ
jgi:signal transduction histidine kinase